MNRPLDKHPKETREPVCLDVSPEKLEAMSPSELAEAMELALDTMTDETYDSAVIDAYLDALDRKAPMPAHPSAESSYQDFQSKLQEYVEQGASKPARRTSKLWSIVRVSLVAALLTTLLVSVAQAAGIDVAGAIARWTESVFSFGAIQSRNDTSHNPSMSNTVPTDIPEEYQELVAEFKKRGIGEYTIPTYIPAGFQADSCALHVAKNGRLDFTAAYLNGDESITFALSENEGSYIGIYEKDGKDVSIYTYGENNHYIFTNLDYNVAAWTLSGVEYTVGTTLSVSDLKK